MRSRLCGPLHSRAKTIQSGAGSASSVSIAAGNGQVTVQVVTFPLTFSSVPIVVVTGTCFGGYLNSCIPTALSISATGFTLSLANSSTTTATGTYTYNWVAIGD